MIRSALTFVVNRLVLIAIFLLALNAFMQNSSCQSGNSQGIMRALAGMQETFRVLNGAFR